MWTGARRIFSAPFLHYNDLLERRPVLTKCITSGIMYGGGDILAQYTETYTTNRDLLPGEEKKVFEINKTRAFIFFIFGSTIAGVAYNYWFNYLNELPALLWNMKQTRHRGKILRAYAYLKAHGIDVKLDLTKLPHAAPLSKWKSKTAKILADQLIFSSTYTLIFFMSIGLMQGTADRLELEFFSEEDSSFETQQLSVGSPPGQGTNAIAGGKTANNDKKRNILDEEDPDAVLVRGQGGCDSEGLTFKAYHHERKVDSEPSTATTTVNGTENRSKLMEAVARLNEFLLQNEAANPQTSTSVEAPTVLPPVPVLSSTPVETEREMRERQKLEDDEAKLIYQVVRKLRIAHAIKSKALTWEDIWFKTWEHTKEVYLETYLADCVVWPPLQLINFTFIPVRFQFLYVNVANLAWNTYLSLMANKKH